MKHKELVQLSQEDLERKLKELGLELIKLNAQVATGTPPKNSGQLKKLKKDVARIMFVLCTKQKIDETKLAQSKAKTVQKNNQKNILKQKGAIKAPKSTKAKKQTKEQKQNE